MTSFRPIAGSVILFIFIHQSLSSQERVVLIAFIIDLSLFFKVPRGFFSPGEEGEGRLAFLVKVIGRPGGATRE